MKKLLVFLLLFSVVLFLTSVLMLEKSDPTTADISQPLKSASHSEESGISPAVEVTKTPIPKTCDLSSYGLDCDIAEYLEKNLAWTVKNGVKFCSYEELGESKGKDRFLYAVCQEFYAEAGNIYIGSGISVPLKLIAANGVFSHWVPRDGSYYSQDIKMMFPKDLQEAAINYANYEVLNKINTLRAEHYFNASIKYSVEKITDQGCFDDIDCLTPGEYLMRSNCQYTARCVQGKCAVVCPDYYYPEK
ncbi:MAG TPA: hypothetical protein P5080_02770 [Candidatus Paceibacterota bacterium]|nr:hypothetical protein [Candidatus Pacearchaeota archaeon]HRZ50892.1 hypothetical protein [Candidatus Paceibacterota bacterium]HSA36613.1 hypothetical protein [Candidatus Paceibacterota bacterium]